MRSRWLWEGEEHRQSWQALQHQAVAVGMCRMVGLEALLDALSLVVVLKEESSAARVGGLALGTLMSGECRIAGAQRRMKAGRL